MKERQVCRLTKADKECQKFEYTMNAVFQLSKRNGWKKIGFTTSSKNERYIEYLCKEYTKHAVEKKMDIIFRKLNPVALYAEALEQAKICDAVVLVERYGYTYYEDIDKTIKIITQAQIELAGVVTYN